MIKMIYEIDPKYKIVNRMIDCNGIDDIKAIKLDYVNYEVIDYEEDIEQ